MKLDQIINRLESSVRENSFIKLRLGAYRGREPELKNLTARLITIRGEAMLSLVTHFQKKDITKNHPIEEGIKRIRSLCGKEFHSAHLFTTQCDVQWQIEPNRKERLRETPPSTLEIPAREHDRIKPRAIESSGSSKWMTALGVTNSQGLVKTGMNGKLRQIQRFAEVLSHSITAANRKKFRVVDMGCGKGYLTFATYEFLSKLEHTELEVIGVELRPDLVSLSNQAAADSDFAHLHFVQGEIHDYPPGDLDLLIALHACDTATDDALFHGIKANAEWIFVAPCCHKELRPQIQPPQTLEDMLRYGIFLERHAEMLTDTLRALLLESQGYRTRVFEFVSPEHTGRNIMIAARRDGTVRTAEARARFEQTRDAFGIQTQRLAVHLHGK